METLSSTGGTKRRHEGNFEVVIDSAAPLPKLLDDIHEREKGSGWKAYRLYWQLLSQRRYSTTPQERSAYHFAVPGHPLNVFTDNYDGTTYYNYFEEFPYRSLLPKYITPINNIQKLDPVVQPLKIQADFKEKISTMRKVFCSLSARSKIAKINEEVIHCPKYVIDLAAALDDEHIPDFGDSYNWHYAGSGNMQLTCIHWVDYLVHSEFCCLYVSRFHKDTMTVDIESSTTFDCGYNILETICSQDNVIALRTMNKVFLLKINESHGNILLDNLCSLDSELLFTSIAFDKHHKNILYVTKLDCTLSIVNLDRMTQKGVKLKKENSSLDNHWNSVIGSTRGSYIHIEKDCITSYDKRTNDVVQSWTDIKGVVDERDCNNITAATQFKDDHGLYFATEHHVFLMDTRCSNTRKLNVLQRWMHGMQCPPTYMSMGIKGNKQFIFLCSQWCEDLCVISNYADRLTRTGELQGVAVPYHPPNIFNVLHEARQKMLCWDNEHLIGERLVTAITGKVEVDTTDGFTVLMQNSLGDVSAHVLYPTYMNNIMEDDSVQRLHEWTRDFKIEKQIFEVSGIHDISEVWKQLRSIPDDYDDLSFSNEPKKFVNESKIYESYSNGELMPELLEVWTIKEARPEQESSDLNTRE